MKHSRLSAAIVITVMGLRLCSAAAPNAAVPVSERPERVETYDEALAHASASGSDIVVFQRGSDWNRLGETLYANVWLNEALDRELGPGFVLVAVDHPEAVGDAAIQRQYSPAPSAMTDGPTASSAPSRLTKLAADNTPLPPSEVTAVASAEGANFTARNDGAWVARGANPTSDTLTLKLIPRHTGSVLRLDFPTDMSLPGTGPGRASNGNFTISEVEAQIGKQVCKFTAAWGSAAEANWGAWQAIDGVSDKTDNLWNPLANQHVRRTLLLLMDRPAMAHSQLTVRLICKGAWGQHVPGCLRAAVISDASLDADLNAVYQAQLLAARNATFSWWDLAHCPRIALLDSAGRAIAADNSPRLGLTPKSLAARIKELRGVRERRDSFWAAAESAEGRQKAELLRQGLDALGIANWDGNDHCYKLIHDRIRQADPADESGATRWLGFGPNGYDAAPGMEAVSKALAEKRYEDALGEVDAQLSDPRNKILDHDRLQRIMLAKFRIYREWKGHEEERFEIQRQIAALDANTYLGIGAVGYLGMYHRTPIPMLSYGWGPEQIKAGLNAWDMADTLRFFDHAGPYKITSAAAGGKDSVKLSRVAIMEGATVLVEATPAAQDVGTGHSAEVTLDFRSWLPDHQYVVHVDVEAAQEHADSNGTFSVEPLFEPPAQTASASPIARPSDEQGRAGAPVDYAPWQKQLVDWLMSYAGSAAPDYSKGDARRALAQAQLLRVCGPEKLAQIAGREKGEAFLGDLLGDTDWLESFLASGPADLGQALENLRFLYCYARADLATPIWKRLATAMALNVEEKSSRYCLYDRFKHIQQAFGAGLLHINFERYTVREMRFAVMTGGTARDYQFLLNDRQGTTSDYFAACWAVPYRDTDDYGHWIQAYGFGQPWRHAYGNFAISRNVGGVCGWASGYAASAARAHGVMSTTVGQPGHCAFIVRAGDAWSVGNNVFGDASTGYQAPGWDGTTYLVAAKLWEPIEDDVEHFMMAQRLAWLAGLQAERAHGQTSQSAASVATFEQTIAAQPLNYGSWLEYVKVLEKTEGVPKLTWLDLGRRAAHTFAPYNQPAWALIHRCLTKASPDMKPAERMQYLLEMHRVLRENAATHLAAYHYEDEYEWQANLLGDKALEIPFFSALLAIHHTPEPQGNSFFAAVLNWGGVRFSKSPKTAAAYAAAIDNCFDSRGKITENDKQVLSQMIIGGLRSASTSEDFETYHTWNAMARRLLPPLQPEDIHLNAAQASAFPKIATFPGELLSKDGMLTISSASQWDRPLSYAQLLSGGIGGWFDTNGEEKPWAQVQLRGEAELSGIVLVNRYEYPPTDPEFQWAAPLKLSVSSDGKTWATVASFDAADSVFRVDLAKKGVRARYVRIERTSSGDEQTSHGRFHFRNFLVYGRRLY